MTAPEHRLYDLFQQLCDLADTGRERLLERVASEDASLALRLRKLLECDASPGPVAHEPGGHPPVPTEPSPATALDAEGSSAALVEQLSTHAPALSRYSHPEEIARGGMGAIQRVWDEDLQRHLARKVALGKPGGPRGEGLDEWTLRRFLEEARVTGQLDHPGVVPVHELGIDADGHLYFTMRLVKGRDLAAVLQLVRTEQGNWTRTRALGVLLKACEALAYAHSRGVVHRDIKPGNVMVGRFGEVYVMDWGVARVLGSEDRKDIRLDLEGARAGDRAPSGPQAGEPTPDLLLRTMDGRVVGTPAYMSPEQARGDIEAVGPRSDVYSVGAILYELLVGHAPYSPPGASLPARAVLAAVLAGPPKGIHERAADVPMELAAICGRAMARDPADRYADVVELAEDLRAYLEHRVVAAYETGAVAELRKWVQRNRPLAATLAVAMLLLVTGLASSLVFARRAEDERESVLRLSAFQELKDLRREADALWPAVPRRVERYDAWLQRARALVAGLDPDPQGDDPGHRRQLEVLRARGRAVGARAGVDAPVPGTPGLRFDNAQDHWWHQQLTELVADIEAFACPDAGLIAGRSAEHGWGIQRRRALALALEQASLSGPQARARWAEALASVADRARSPGYAGLRLRPQLGLLPLRQDPRSGLWEFWHVQSGREPQVGADDRWMLSGDTGLVFVLVPAGSFLMGAQRDDPAGPNHDAGAGPDEVPVHRVRVDAFLLSKYEMTQGQWTRLLGENPSRYPPGFSPMSGTIHSAIHPVEQVSWEDCVRVLGMLGLCLPSEAQWEYAARAGTTSPWWTGSGKESLRGAANLADRAAVRWGASWPAADAWPELDDGFGPHAPVDRFRPNPFGLHNVHGNVWEWCQDAWDASYYARSPERNPVHDAAGARVRVSRGGGFNRAATNARSANRGDNTPERRNSNLGLRPACRVETD